MEAFKLNVKLTKKTDAGRYLGRRFKAGSGSTFYIIDKVDPNDTYISFYEEGNPDQRHDRYCTETDFEQKLQFGNGGSKWTLEN